MRLAFALMLFAAAPAGAEQLRIGATYDYPPYLFRQDGKLVGMDADLMAEVCARGGFDCVWVELSLQELLDAVRDGGVDVGVSGIGISAERELVMDFTCPYYVAEVFTGTFLARDADVDLRSVAIAVATPSLYERAMIDGGYRTLPFANEAEAMRAVQEGRADAFFGANQLPDAPTGLVTLGDYPIRTAGPALALGENADDLRQRLDAILADLSQEGRLAAMQRAWLDIDQGDVIARCNEATPQA